MGLRSQYAAEVDMTKGPIPFSYQSLSTLGGASTKLSLPATAFFFHTVYSGQNTACAIFPPWCKEASMEVYVSERRISPRHLLKTALRVRVWKSGSTERRAESQNLSESGTFFATDEPMAIGSAVEVLLKIPEVITRNPTTEWRWSSPSLRRTRT